MNAEELQVCLISVCESSPLFIHCLHIPGKISFFLLYEPEITIQGNAVLKLLCFSSLPSLKSVVIQPLDVQSQKVLDLG